MNTHDIELPPLPKASKMYDIPGYDEEELKDYARAAVEADRQQRESIVTDDMRSAIRFAPFSAYWSDVLRDIFGPDAREGIDALERRLRDIEDDRQRRGEPVAWGAFYFGGKRNGKLYSHTETEAQIDAYIADVHRSNDSITLRKGPLYTAPQPAEPVKSHLKVSYDDKGDCLYVVCDSNEPADAEEDDKGILYRRAISDGRLVGITIMNFMGRHAESRYGKGTP